VTTRGGQALTSGILLGIAGGGAVAVGAATVASDEGGFVILMVLGGIAAYIGVALVAMGSIAIGVRWGMLDRDEQRAIDAVADEWSAPA
jgi:hypothetical protein